MYARKSTAVHHLEQGLPFTNKKFQRFWYDREVCAEALVNQPNLFWFVVRHNPDIEWDDVFMATLFTRLLDQGRTLPHLNFVGKFLPPSITCSKAIALKAATISSWALKHFLAPDLTLDEDIRRAYSPVIENDGPPLSKQTVTLFTDRPELLIDLISACPHLYWNVPDSMRRSREVSLAMCARTASFRYAYGGLDDDEGFVLDVLERTHELKTEIAFSTASYRLRKIVRGECPMNYLRKVVAARTLEATLSRKEATTDGRLSIAKV